jgi:YidC/Oxa1 family membrane protein insertase
LTIVKDFQLSTNYLVFATVQLSNRTAAPLALPAQEWVIGTATPMNVQDRGAMTVGLIWSDGQTTSMMYGARHFSGTGFGCMPKTPNSEYREGASNVVWTAVFNQFFALAAMPQDRAAQVISRKIELPRPDETTLRENPKAVPFPEGYETTLQYPALTLASNQVVQRQFSLYAGPKEYRTLASIAGRFNNNVDQVMGFDTTFPFYRVGGFFSKALLLGMNWLHDRLRISYGWAIIAITVIIKLLFWPLTQASNRSMKQKQALAPEVNALKEKYKDDLQKFFQKQRELYRKNNVSQMGGCLPMLIQIPVFFGRYGMIRTAIELRGAHFLWIADLSQPDTLFVIPGLGIPFNLLPIVYIATARWQSHLTPPSPGMDPAQQKMLRWMPMIFLLILYNFSSGLALYMTVQNLLTIAQTKLIRTPPVQVQPTKAPALTPPQKKRK